MPSVAFRWCVAPGQISRMQMMKRILLPVILALGVVGVVGAQEEVIYQDRAAKKEATYKGKIDDESAAGIKIKVIEDKKTVTKFVAAGDIVQVTYPIAGVATLDYRAP